MICLHCGYCCIKYFVTIIKDPSKPYTEKNLTNYNGLGTGCPHLLGNKIGEYECSVHNKKWYKETPCYKHTQIENKNTFCRLGEYFLKNERLLKNLETYWTIKYRHYEITIYKKVIKNYVKIKFVNLDSKKINWYNFVIEKEFEVLPIIDIVQSFKSEWFER